WSRSKARSITSAEIIDALPVPGPPGQEPARPGPAYLAVIHVEFAEGDPEIYVLPLGAAPAKPEGAEPPLHASVARVKTSDGEMVLFDAAVDPGFARALLHGFDRRRTWNGEVGKVSASVTRAYRRSRGSSGEALDASPMQAEQTNTSIVFGDRLV